MKKDLNAKTIGIIASVIFFLISIAGFVWLWSSSHYIPNTTATISGYKTIDIESAKNQAAELLDPDVKDNFSGMPVAAPTSDKVGRDNPFAGI